MRLRITRRTPAFEGETKFVLSMFNNFVISAGMVSRVLSKIVAMATGHTMLINLHLKYVSEGLNIATIKNLHNMTCCYDFATESDNYITE
jgi:hypothetical protein